MSLPPPPPIRLHVDTLIIDLGPPTSSPRDLNGTILATLTEAGLAAIAPYPASARIHRLARAIDKAKSDRGAYVNAGAQAETSLAAATKEGDPAAMVQASETIAKNRSNLAAVDQLLEMYRQPHATAEAQILPLAEKAARIKLRAELANATDAHTALCDEVMQTVNQFRSRINASLARLFALQFAQSDMRAAETAARRSIKALIANEVPPISDPTLDWPTSGAADTPTDETPETTPVTA